jgi:hypothetical protein
MRSPSRLLLLSPGRTGSQALSTILAELSPPSGVAVRHEHPLARTLIPLAHLHPPTAQRLALWLVFPVSEGALQQIRIDPLLSHCAADPLARCADRVVLITRQPSAWVESLARKIRHQKLFPLIRALPILRPPAPPSLVRALHRALPEESPYLLGLLAAYVALHQTVAALHLDPPILQLRYEQLFGGQGSSQWKIAWQALWGVMAWPKPVPFSQLSQLQQRRHNAAPVALRRALRDPDGVDAVVEHLIHAAVYRDN